MKQLLFLHVPKVGGNYIGATLEGIDYTGNHFVYIDKEYLKQPSFPPKPAGVNKLWFNFAEEDIEIAVKSKQLVFGSVRNPFDWLVSYWHVIPDGRGTNNFSVFIKTIADRIETWPSKKLIFFPFFANDGRFLLDFVIRQESLDDDLNWLCSRFKGLKYKKSERVKVSANREFKDYRKYYSTELIDIVNKTWKRELDLYGYSFEGRTKMGFISREVSEKTKELLEYFWDVDKLYFAGKELK